MKACSRTAVERLLPIKTHECAYAQNHPEHSRERGGRNLFEVLSQQDSLLVAADSILGDFVKNYPNESPVPAINDLKRRTLDFIAGISKEDNYETLVNDINAVNTGNAMELNLKDYLLSYLEYSEGVDTSESLNTIWEIAAQCVF